AGAATRGRRALHADTRKSPARRSGTTSSEEPSRAQWLEASFGAQIRPRRARTRWCWARGLAGMVEKIAVGEPGLLDRFIETLPSDRMNEVGEAVHYVFDMPFGFPEPLPFRTPSDRPPIGLIGTCAIGENVRAEVCSRRALDPLPLLPRASRLLRGKPSCSR